jgi:hypothetical protein
MKTNIHFLSHLFQFFLEWEMCETKIVDKSKTHFKFHNFFSENSAVWEIMRKKLCRAGQAADDNMMHVHCMLNT